MEPLVKELLKNHELDKDLTGAKVQKEVKKLRKKYKRTYKDSENYDQCIGLDWSNADLSNFNLSTMDLSSSGKSLQANFHGVNFSQADLREIQAVDADFSNSKLFNAKLDNSILEVSDFTDANLEFANLDNVDFICSNFNRANLRKASMNGTILTEASLEQANLYGIDFNEIKGLEFANFKRLDESNIYEAKQAYLHLENFFRMNGVFDRYGIFYYRRKFMDGKEKKHQKNYLGCYANTIFKYLCGYGERPQNVLILSIFVILAYALGFIFLGGPIGEGRGDNIFVDSLYFSGVTFTTLGFGDLHPNNSSSIMKILATSEAYLGVIFMPLFIVCLSRRLIR